MKKEITKDNLKLVEYSREVVPMIKAIKEKKDAMKELVEGDEQAQDIVQAIKDLQGDLENYLLSIKGYEASSAALKELERDLGLAIKGAARGTSHKVPELKAYFTARAAEATQKVIEKGELFVSLDNEIQS